MNVQAFRRGIAGAAVLAVLTIAGPAQAAVITSPGGGYQVGITTLGNIFDRTPYIGFLRVSDVYDPIAPGTPREAYGVSAGTVSGFADPEYLGVTNILSVSSVFLANTASVVTVLNAGSGDLLRISQAFDFAAENILRIAVTVTNISGASQAVLFAREVDHDINPAFSTTTVATGPTGPILDASFSGFESADPLVAYSSSVGAGGTFGVADLGNGMKIDLGTLANGESSSFYIYHGLSTLAQDGPTSDTLLRAQLAGLGASYILTSIEDDGTPGYPAKAAALAYGVIPEPSSLLCALIGGLACSGYAIRKRRAAGR